MFCATADDMCLCLVFAAVDGPVIVFQVITRLDQLAKGLSPRPMASMPCHQRVWGSRPASVLYALLHVHTHHRHDLGVNQPLVLLDSPPF